MDLPQWLTHAIDAFGYLLIFAAVGIESMGIPFPGETTLVAGAIYAGTGRGLNIFFVIVAASLGAIGGDNLGYTIGRYGGYPLLRKLIRALHLKESTLDVTQRYFERHGSKTVFIGRFFAILRCWAAFLAGVNQMKWRTFLVWNAAGGIIWAAIFGTLGFVLGNNLPLLGRILGTLGIVGTIFVSVLIVVLLIVWLLHHRRAERAAIALAALQSPVTPHTPPPHEATLARRRLAFTQSSIRAAQAGTIGSATADPAAGVE
jgi:membrane protein DedA with SNARE-associated domain